MEVWLGVLEAEYGTALAHFQASYATKMKAMWRHLVQEKMEEQEVQPT